MGGKSSKKKLEAEWKQLEDFIINGMKLQSKKDKVLFNNVKEGKCINDTYEDGSTTLHFACSEEHENVVNFLLENNADVTIKDRKGNLALMYCYSKKNIVKQLTKKVPNIKTEKLLEYYKSVLDVNNQIYLSIRKEARKPEVLKDDNDYDLSKTIVDEHLEKMREIIGMNNIRNYFQSVNSNNIGTRYKIKF